MKNIIVIIVVFFTFSANAQISFAGFDTINCLGPLTNVYSYVNYDIGSHGHGYRILKNGIQVYDKQNSLGPLYCRDLIFINDTIGFIVETDEHANTSVFKSSDFGSNWVIIGSGAPNYFGLFIINSYYAYLVTGINNIVLVKKCSDIQVPFNLIYDTSVNQEIFKTDTILCSSLCHIDSLQIFIKNNSDTIFYQINFTFIESVQLLSYNELGNYIYPIPASDYISLSGETGEIDFACLYNTLGQLVVEFSKESILDNYFKLPDLENGVYLLFVKNQNRAGTYKFIVKNNKHKY